MKRTNGQLMQEARSTLEGQWGIAAGGTFIYMLVSNIISQLPYLGGVLSLLIGGPLSLGVMFFTIALARRRGARIEQLFEGFNDFMRAFVTYLVMVVFIILWTLLLIIPGIMKAYSYSMTFFILAEDKEIQPMDALRKSEELMEGHRMRLFYLHLRFIGISILCVFTLFIGLFWAVPYFGVASVKFYEDIMGKEAGDLDYSDHLVEEV